MKSKASVEGSRRIVEVGLSWRIGREARWKAGRVPRGKKNQMQSHSISTCEARGLMQIWIWWFTAQSDTMFGSPSPHYTCRSIFPSGPRRLVNDKIKYTIWIITTFIKKNYNIFSRWTAKCSVKLAFLGWFDLLNHFTWSHDHFELAQTALYHCRPSLWMIEEESQFGIVIDYC